MVLGIESWFLNFSQFSYEANTPETLADIPRPYFEYSLWGLFKGAELSSIIGGCLAHPLYRYYLTKRLTPERTTPNSHKIIRASCRRLQGRFLLAGLAFGPAAALAHIFINKLSESEVRDLCYRIRCDGNGLTIDRCTLMCGFVGWYWKRFQGAVDGINIGIAYALFNNKFLSKYTSPMLRDKVQEADRYESVEAAQERRSRLVHFMAELDKQKAAKLQTSE